MSEQFTPSENQESIYCNEIREIFTRIEEMNPEDPRQYRAIQRGINSLVETFLGQMYSFGFLDSDLASKGDVFNEEIFPEKNHIRIRAFSDFMQNTMREKGGMVWEKFEKAARHYQVHSDLWAGHIDHPRNLLRGMSVFSSLVQFFPLLQEEVTVGFLDKVLADPESGGFSDLFPVGDVCKSFVKGSSDLDVNASAARFFLKREGLPEESVYEDLQMNFYFTGRRSLWEKISARALEKKKQNLRWDKNGYIAKNIEGIVSFGETSSEQDSQYGKKALQYLVVDCGISNVARYSEETLWRQYRERDDMKTPYGVMLVAKADHNGSARSMETILPDFVNSTDHLGILVRIAECESGKDCLRKLLRFQHKYQEGAGRISFLALRAHGNEGGMLFGMKRNKKFVVDKSRINGLSMTHVLGEKGVLGPGAPIAFLSCSVGKKGGFADQVAEKRPNLSKLAASSFIGSTKHILLERDRKTGILAFNAKFLRRKGWGHGRSVSYSGRLE